MLTGDKSTNNRVVFKGIEQHRKRMAVIFRCNASPSVGYGHLARCRALAHALKEQGRTCVMLGPDAADARPEDQNIFSEWIPISEWRSSAEDASFLIELARRLDAFWAVLDDYRVDETYQLTLRAAGLQWLQFEGTARKPLWADLIVNANPAARPEDYTEVIRNPKTQLLLGPRYAILRPEFWEVLQRNQTQSIKQILVTFGGGDDRGAIKIVLATLIAETPSTIKFLVVSGARNPNNADLTNWIKNYGQGRIRLHIDPPLVSALFLKCDLAVMAGGTTTYEAACCGLPMILIAIANNQIAQSRGWADLGAAIYLGMLNDLDKVNLVKAYREVAEARGRLLDPVSIMKLVDGYGARITAELLTQHTN